MIRTFWKVKREGGILSLTELKTEFQNGIWRGAGWKCGFQWEGDNVFKIVRPAGWMQTKEGALQVFIGCELAYARRHPEESAEADASVKWAEDEMLKL